MRMSVHIYIYIYICIYIYISIERLGTSLRMSPCLRARLSTCQPARAPAHQHACVSARMTGSKRAHQHDNASSGMTVIRHTLRPEYLTHTYLTNFHLPKCIEQIHVYSPSNSIAV